MFSQHDRVAVEPVINHPSQAKELARWSSDDYARQEPRSPPRLALHRLRDQWQSLQSCFSELGPAPTHEAKWRHDLRILKYGVRHRGFRMARE